MAGKTPADSDKLKTNVKVTLTTEANRFEISCKIPSGPRKAHSTSSSEISIVDNFMTVIPQEYALKKPSK
jgi:hypothetical protein